MLADAPSPPKDSQAQMPEPCCLPRRTCHPAASSGTDSTAWTHDLTKSRKKINLLLLLPMARSAHGGSYLTSGGFREHPSPVFSILHPSSFAATRGIASSERRSPGVDSYSHQLTARRCVLKQEQFTSGPLRLFWTQTEICPI